MGQDSTESSEDSDLVSKQPQKFSVAAARNDTIAKPSVHDEHGRGNEYDARDHKQRSLLLGQVSRVVKRPEKRHKCSYANCSAAFSRPHKLKAHEQTHTNERSYVCTVEGCDKSYTNQSHLKRHEQTSHHKKAIDVCFKCTFEGCGLILKTNQALKKHYKRKHEGLDYKCDKCPAMFKKHRQLTVHSYDHARNLTFSCEKCKKVFETEHLYKKHCSRGHKIYKCSVENCSEGPFAVWSLFRKHMALKHRPDFICDICQRSFPFLFRLKMHKESQHNTSVAKPWSCTYPECSLSFKEKRYLSQHVRHIHEGSCFECPKEDCTKIFYWKASLDKHIRLHAANRPLPRPRKKAKKRKDAGKPRKSIAVALSSVSIPKEVEESLIEKEVVNSDDDILIVNKA